jgi:hypothetical protein
MDKLSIDTRYLTEIYFQSERGEELSVVFGKDRKQACIMMHGNIPLHTDSTPEKPVAAAARRRGNEDVAVYTAEKALAFVAACFAHFDAEPTDGELVEACREMVKGIRSAETAKEVRRIFDLINQKDYASAHAAWRRMDTFDRDGFPDRLIAWLGSKIASPAS